MPPPPLRPPHRPTQFVVLKRITSYLFDRGISINVCLRGLEFRISVSIRVVLW
jgi:hypothetical protein